LNSFPIKLFDREKYIDAADCQMMGTKTDYYKKENRRLRKKHPESSPYIFNKHTLGLRLDSKQEIGVFRYGNTPVYEKIDDFFGYAKALVGTILESQGDLHLHSDDWQWTIYIDTLGVGTTDFDLSDKKKKRLVASGVKGTKTYFDWYDKPKSRPANQP